LGIAWEEDC
jgi:hypothetical protein